MLRGGQTQALQDYSLPACDLYNTCRRSDSLDLDRASHNTERTGRKRSSNCSQGNDVTNHSSTYLAPNDLTTGNQKKRFPNLIPSSCR